MRIFALVLILILHLTATPLLAEEVETKATWYGPGFQGHKTASGERFDDNQMTAASRTLPFGTKLTVKNPQNGKSCDVTVNDRGPFARGAGLDLSKAAAQRIGLKGSGRVICSDEGVSPASDKPVKPLPIDQTPPTPRH